MELVLTGIGQEVSLSNMSETNNFLLFKRSDGSPLRVHVPEESIKELLSSLKSDSAPPQQYERHEPIPQAPDEEAVSEFGGDLEPTGQDPSFLLENDEEAEQAEEPTDEDDVPSL